MPTKYKRKELGDYGWDKSKNINDKKELSKFFQDHHVSEKFISHLFPELYNKINEIPELSIFTKFSQKLYHFLYNDLELNIGKCPVCGKRCRFVNFKVGYKKYCNPKCQMSDPNMLSKIKKTCLEKYGVDHPLKSELIKNKIYKTNYKKYGNKFASKTEYCKEKAKNTCLRKYGVTAYSKTNEYKQHMQNYKIYPALRQDVKEERAKTCKEKYGAVCFLQSKEYFDSIHGKKLDKLSKLERGIEKYFKKYNINYETQYISKLYPYRCDFYLPESNLYIEINGTWTHGNEPFNLFNKEHIDLLKIWKEKSKSSKYYEKAIKTWTKSDLQKISIAEKNNLNYLILYQTNPEECFVQIIYNLSFNDMNKVDKELINKCFPEKSLNKKNFR